ncbi:MAG TPA: TonB-dependent receptor plug domain-containing protein, partial [Chitinophagaceae bacterium]|nr:TonB-dependent receptor plug domain-containing protein [Chitinophagaceae bacterium]
MKKIFNPLVRGASRFYLAFLLLPFLSSYSYGQTVSGSVSDAEGKPISGVTVAVKGKQTATTTNPAGQFSITASGSDVLLFSSIGFATKEVAVNNASTLRVTLEIESQSIGEVVVTALGITKEARRLGYAVTSVKPDELTINRTPNALNALQGKVAGVNISSLGTGPGGTSKIRIRGQSAITGGGSPLIVINGVPIDNSNFNNNTVGVAGGGVYSDGGDGLSSINPDDIESMTVLKGAPAAALYGNRASNGVIMITTKTKGKGRGLGVSINT